MEIKDMTDNTQETRMDRVERYLQEFTMVFTKGMLELKESQEMTDAQQNRTDAQILELKDAQKKTDAQILELKDAQKKTDDQLKKTIKKLDDIGENLGKMGIVQGEVAEELFYRNVKGLFSSMDMRFVRIRRNVKVQGLGEYDIVADDKGRVLVIEVKNKLSRRLVDEFMQKKLPRFRTLLPEYRDSKILAGIGALVVKDDVGRYAEKAGLFVLTQTSDGGAALLNRKDFRPKEFL
jgi:Holliday junction resolvase-like predicted endonuclease